MEGWFKLQECATSIGQLEPVPEVLEAVNLNMLQLFEDKYETNLESYRREFEQSRRSEAKSLNILQLFWSIRKRFKSSDAVVQMYYEEKLARLTIRDDNLEIFMENVFLDFELHAQSSPLVSGFCGI